MVIDCVTFSNLRGPLRIPLCVVLAKAAAHAGTDIRFQFVDRLDCEAQTEDDRGQDGPGRMSRVKKVHLLVE